MNYINNEYVNLLKIISSLSGLFSDSRVPYLYYRNAENLFCHALNAKNLSRDDSAFDALLCQDGKNIAIGLKTFICKNKSSMEKIAEFNQLSSEFDYKNSNNLVKQIAKARNERIAFAQRLYDVEKAIYHIVSRRENELMIFEENYDFIDLDSISNIKRTEKGVMFSDGTHDYSYNFSKSTLFKKFILPTNYYSIPIHIIPDPYHILLQIKNDFHIEERNYYEQVILPLYSPRQNNIPERSGLNQWNAQGRKRSLDEVYILIPSWIHQKYPHFFPKRDAIFKLITPDNQALTAKVCQDGGKALMTNPNSALADWLLRKLLQIQPGTLATMQDLKRVDCDSVVITKINNEEYRIDKAKFGKYQEFLNSNQNTDR